MGPASVEKGLRQRFDLAVVDGSLHAEVDRLVALGAALAGSAGAVELTDPDGIVFRIVQG